MAGSFRSEVLIVSDRAMTFEQQFEVIERKSIGHPDTLADMIAEQCSYEYSTYCLERFGVIPNHWVDKCLIQGGRASLSFGSGEITSPIIIRIFGKTTNSIGPAIIPYVDIFRSAVKYVLTRVLNITDYDRNFSVEVYSENARGTGRPNSWYSPVSAADIVPPRLSTSNDASICSGYAPLSRLQRAILDLDAHIHANVRIKYPAIGTDIKLLARRFHDELHLEACVPLLCDLTPSLEFYEDLKKEIAAEFTEFLARSYSARKIAISLNTRDDAENHYLLVQGTAADTGDCGVVGRGNRYNGLITPNHPMSMEAQAGKNPVNHAGRLYQLFAGQLSAEICQRFNSSVQCFITSATGDPIGSPRSIVVRIAHDHHDNAVLESFTRDAIASMHSFIGDVGAQRTWFNRGYQFGGFSA